MNAAARRAGLLVPGMGVAVALVVLLALGIWQLDRRSWKAGLIATLQSRAAAAPVPLPLPARWAELAADTDEFRRMRLRVRIDPKAEGRVYAGGAALRADVKGPGYFAFAPARLDDGGVVVVNRGFVAHPNPDASLRPIAVPDGAVDIVGAIRFPERSGWLVAPYSAGQDLWTVRDHRAMAVRYGWGDVAPFYLEQEAPVPPGGLPKPGPLAVTLRNDHLGYAITWFGLAVVLLATFVVFVRGRRRVD